MTERLPPVHALTATTPQGDAGILQRSKDYLFTYSPDATASREVSLAMPARREQYSSRELFPIFQMNLPEGYVFEQLRQRFAKTTTLDPMMLLAMTGGEAAIGRLQLVPEIGMARSRRALPLADILANQGTANLFDQLVNDYLLRSGVSGMQPKLLVPEAGEGHYPGKGMLATSELIVKTAGPGYPGLAVNEFVCMSIAREADIPVPDFFLSEDHQRFVMRRFDRSADGVPLGFEDMSVLTTRGNDGKYSGSYEQMVKVLSLYCVPEARRAAMAQVFDQLALSCLVGNGDAHLKNFGVSYTDTSTNDACMAPCYDIVSTTCYIPDDPLALSLNGQRSLFVARADLLGFGSDTCGLRDVPARLARLLDAADTITYTHGDLMEEVVGLREAIEQGSEQLRAQLLRA